MSDTRAKKEKTTCHLELWKNSERELFAGFKPGYHHANEFISKVYEGYQRAASSYHSCRCGSSSGRRAYRAGCKYCDLRRLNVQRRLATREGEETASAHKELSRALDHSRVGRPDLFRVVPGNRRRRVSHRSYRRQAFQSCRRVAGRRSRVCSRQTR